MTSIIFHSYILIEKSVEFRKETLRRKVELTTLGTMRPKVLDFPTPTTNFSVNNKPDLYSILVCRQLILVKYLKKKNPHRHS